MRNVILLLVGLVSSLAAGADLLLKDGFLVDPAARTVTRGSLLLREGRIHKIYREAPLGFPGRTVDVSGKWIIPGLRDMHVHAYGDPGPDGSTGFLGVEGTAERALRAGVTGVLDLFYGDEDAIFAFRDKQRLAGGPGADVFAAGPIFTCTGGHGTEYGAPTRVINSPGDAEREINDLARKKPDVIKIVYDHARKYPSIDRATLRAAIAAAKKRGLKTVIHIGTWTDAMEAVRDGASAITHLYEQPLPAGLVSLMRERGTYEIPTMAVQTDFLQITRDPRILELPLLKAVAPQALLAAYRDPSKFTKAAREWLGWQTSGEAEYFRSLRALAEGGVKLMTGTDAGNLGTFQAFSEHRELALFTRAGLSSWQALAAATTVPGEFLGRHYGMREGDEASLVVLDASPIESIEATQRVRIVVHHGRIVEPR